MNLRVPQPDGDRLQRHLQALSEMVDPDLPGWTRRPFTALYGRGRQWVSEQMRYAGLAVTVDAAANLIGRRPGSDPNLPPIVIGSHTDTVMGGGRFDGPLGVVAALEAARILQEAGISLRHPLEVIDFTAEEPTDFGVSAVGSRGMTGKLTPQLLAQRDSKGQSLHEALAGIGGRPDQIQAERRPPGSIAAYIEVHIEQGPVLEQTGNMLGVVTALVGITRIRVKVEGQPDHAGTTPMEMRRDALTGAAEMALALEQICSGSDDGPVVGTVGKFDVEPNATNVVPGQVEFVADLRAADEALVDALVARFHDAVEGITARRRLGCTFDVISRSPPVKVGASLQEMIYEVCLNVDSRVIRLVSGAGHDANHMAEIGPAGMIFVPSKDGRSHCAQEFTDPDGVWAGAAALLQAVVLCDERI